MKWMKKWAGALCVASSLVAAGAQAENLAIDDPNIAVTVMQFTVKDPAQLPQLKARMAAMRDHLRTQPGLIDNVLMENRNAGAAPQYVGVSRWTSFKNWEAVWTNSKTLKLIADIGEVGTVVPGTFSPVKK